MNLNKKKDPGAYTIDIKHTQLLDEFHKIETEIIPKLIIEKTQLKDKIHNLKNIKKIYK